jgi:hypothetical protein
MARDTGSYTLSNPPVADPAQRIAATATNNTTAAVITYTTASAHNLKVGQPVVANGFSNAWLNYDPASATGNGNPAVVASVTSSTVFTVNMPAVVSTASSSVAGFVTQSALVSNSPYGNAWLPTSADTNLVVAREWGNFPIQSNEDRAANVAITGVSANGSQVTYTVDSGHGLVAGQRVSIQGIKSGSYNSDSYNGDSFIASTTSTTIVFNSTNTEAVKSFANGAIVRQATIGGAKIISSAVGAVAYAGSTATTTATTAAAATSVGVNSTSGLAVGMGVTATVATIATGTVITAVGSGTVTVNPALSSAVASAAVLTFSASTSNQYVTQQAHGLVSGQNIAITGASNPTYNVSGVATVVNANTFSVKAPVFKIKGVSGTAGTGIVGDGTNVLYSTDVAHGLVAGDKVAITAMAPSGYNTANGTVIAAGLTFNAFAIANTTTSTVTAFGEVVENSGTFSGTASVAGDNGWAATYAYPSGNLDPSLDDHDRVTNSERGYPAFAPAAIVPNVVGLTMSNAIQRLRASGLQTGSVGFSSDIAVSAVSTTATNVTYTTGTTAHNLGIGDTVNLSGGSVAAHNLGDVRVAAVSGFTFTINTAGVTGTVGTSLVARPKNTVVSAQDPAAGSSIADSAAQSVNITRNYGI